MLRLAVENAHERDRRVDFNEERHEYEVDGRVVKGSVSSLWASKFEVFDAIGTARKCYPKWARLANGGGDEKAWGYLRKYISLVEKKNPLEGSADDEEDDPSVKGYGNLIKYLWKKGKGKDECVEAVVELWSKLGVEASERGTFVHRQAELHCNDEPYENGSETDAEIIQYEAFRRDHPLLMPYRTEWSVFAYLDAFVVAGQVDCVYVDDAGEFHMVDYKCTAHELSPKNPYNKFGAFPFDKVPDTSYGHYACQQNIYRFVLENFYGVSLRSCKLLRVHSTIGRYELIDVPNLQKEVGWLFRELKTKTVSRNLKLTSRQRSRAALVALLNALKFLFYLRRRLKMSDITSPARSEDDSERSRSDADADAAETTAKRKKPAPYEWWRPEYDLLANKIIEEGGFPVKLGGFHAHQGVEILNEGELVVASKKGGPIETSDLIPETSSFYYQPQFDNQKVFVVFFGTAKVREDNTKFEFKSSFKMSLDNVSQQDVVKFQGLPPWRRRSDGRFEELTGEQVHDSIKDSTVYRLLEKSFSFPLATQISKGKMHKDHVAKKEDPDGKYLDMYIRQRLGKINTDAPYDGATTDYTWLKDKTKLALPIFKDEEDGANPWKTYVEEENATEKRKPVMEVELPIKPLTNSNADFEMKTNRSGEQKITVRKVFEDGSRKKATAEDIVADFPEKRENANASTKVVMVYAQYDSTQTSKFAGPGIRCNIREVIYTVVKNQESVDDAFERFNS